MTPRKGQLSRHSIMSRDEARRKKRQRYFTGQPCVHGHLAQRYVSNGKCVPCHNGWRYYERLAPDQIGWFCSAFHAGHYVLCPLCGLTGRPPKTSRSNYRPLLLSDVEPQPQICHGCGVALSAGALPWLPNRYERRQGG